MDFLVDLPTAKGFTSILVVVDRFSKMIRLLPLVEGTSAEHVATEFFTHVVSLHGVPSSIISNRDPCFQSKLWTTLLNKHLGTTLTFSTVYHPQTDG